MLHNLTHMPIYASVNSPDLPEGGILNFDSGLMINIGIQMFNIILLIIALTLLLYKPVKKYLTDRQARISEEIDSAEKLKEEAAELKQKYESLIAEIDVKREEILSNARKKAMEKSDMMLFEARREADILLDRAMSEIETERKNVMSDMKEQMIEISALMASRFVKVSMDKETADKYIDEAFADWEDEIC